MSTHTYLLAVLIGSAITRSLALSAQAPVKHVMSGGTYHTGASRLTRMHARRGGRGRRRGRTDDGGHSSGYRVSEGAGTAVPAKKSPSTAAASATLAVQHAASHHELLGVAYTHKAVLRPGVLSQALLRIAKPLVQLAQAPAKQALLVDPRLTAVFMAASSPVAAGDEPRAPASTTIQALSGPQAADIVWALGLLQWCPPSGGGRRRLARLVELVARTASSKRGIEEGYITNVLWALERLEISGALSTEQQRRAAGEAGRAERDMETMEAAVGEEWPATAEVGVGFESEGDGEAGDDAWEGSRAVRELRRRVRGLPFQAIPSLFKGLRVEDFRQEVAFSRDEINLGGEKVLSESRLTAWQSSDGLPFAYSGKVMEPMPFSPNVLRLRDALFERTGVLYDGVLLNLYESRSSAMRYHSDPDVGTIWTQDTSVVSVGDTRQFSLRQTLDHSRGRHAFYLFSGDCVRMTEGCQRDYQHCVKVAKEDVGARISLVFKQSISGLERERRRCVAVG